MISTTYKWFKKNYMYIFTHIHRQGKYDNLSGECTGIHYMIHSMFLCVGKCE